MLPWLIVENLIGIIMVKTGCPQNKRENTGIEDFHFLGLIELYGSLSFRSSPVSTTAGPDCGDLTWLNGRSLIPPPSYGEIESYCY